MKVLFEHPFYGADLRYYMPGVRVVSDTNMPLPSSAQRVSDDTPVSPDNEEDVVRPDTLREIAGATAEEAMVLRTENAELKERLDRLEKMLVDQAGE